MSDGFSNIVLGTGNCRIHGQTTRYESRDGSREGAACTMCMTCQDTLSTQFNKAFPIEVHIDWIGNSMASLHHDMPVAQCVHDLRRRTDIVQRLDPVDV